MKHTGIYYSEVITKVNRESIKEKFISRSGLPKCAFDGYAQIDLVGNEEAVIDGCKSIIEYSSEKIVLGLGRICIAFCGDGLEMNVFDGEQAVIKGKFLTIEFS